MWSAKSATTQTLVIYLESPCRQLFGQPGKGVDHLGVVPFAMVVPHRPCKVQYPAGTRYTYRIGLLEVFGALLLVGRP